MEMITHLQGFNLQQKDRQTERHNNFPKDPCTNMHTWIVKAHTRIEMFVCSFMPRESVSALGSL